MPSLPICLETGGQPLPLTLVYSPRYLILGRCSGSVSGGQSGVAPPVVPQAYFFIPSEAGGKGHTPVSSLPAVCGLEPCTNCTWEGTALKR